MLNITTLVEYLAPSHWLKWVVNLGGFLFLKVQEICKVLLGVNLIFLKDPTLRS